MKIIPNCRKCDYVARVVTFLIVVALAAEMLGCGDGSVVRYDLTVSSTDGGSVTTPGEGTFTYDEGTVVDLVAAPDAGYRFVEWTGNVGTTADINATATNITMNGDYSITANFAEILEYDLTISSTTGGSVTTPGEGTFTYDEGTVVDLAAQADEGYYFANWSGDVGTISNVNAVITTITMNDDYEITANFEQIPPGQFSLTISSTSGGSVTVPGEATFTYDEGTVVNLVAETEEDYHFVNWTGDVDTIANVDAAATTITMDGDYSISANFAQYTPMITAGCAYTVGLKSDGTAVAVGDNGHGQCNVGSWTDIAQVTAGCVHTVGLEPNGTVVAVGDNDLGQCNIENWTDIIQISAAGYHTVGLKSDGTVVAVGRNNDGECNVGDWTGITQAATGYYHTVGLKSGGTVVAVGDNDVGQCDVGGWTDIVQVAAGAFHTVGLKSDGTVVAVGWNYDGQCNVGNWTDISQVAAGIYHTVGLKTDGSAVAVGRNHQGQCDVGGWTNIIQITAGLYHTVGLKSDGTVVAVGEDYNGQCDVGAWDLN